MLKTGQIQNKTTLIAILISMVLTLLSCHSSQQQDNEEITTDTVQAVNIDSASVQKDSIVEEPPMSAIEQTMIAAGLVDIQTIDSTIQVDVRYATTNNFMGQVLYKDYHKVYLQPEIAKDLAKAQQALKTIDSNLTLLVFDGARPRSIQQMMWDAMDTIPFHERVKFLSNPKNGSIHNFGCAVDLTIKNLTTGKLLDMGAGYDDLRKIAYPRFEEKFLKSGDLTQEQVNNRHLLYRVMRKGGFYVIQTEWWHFNAFPRAKAQELYDIIE